MRITPEENVGAISAILPLSSDDLCNSAFSHQRPTAKQSWSGVKWKEYKKKTIITAYQLTSPILITANSDSLQNGGVGDFLIIGTGGVDIYVCPKQQFLSTYAKHRAGKYRYIKKGNVLARQIDTKLKLQNVNG